MEEPITVKDARIKAKKSQEACARFLDLSLTGYRRKESKGKFWPHELVALGHFLGVSFEFFIECGCHKRTQEADAS